MNIYSRIDSTQVLHIINRKRDIQEGRCDMVDPDQFIQCASLRLPRETTFKPHRHIWNQPTGDHIPQESWVVISGLVKVILYDIDNTILHTDVLEPGDISITLQGGHNYELLQDSVVYEFKTGPYQGQQHDKTFI